MEIFIIIVFVLGYLAITLEHSLKIDKLIPAVVMMAVCWALIAFGLDDNEIDDKKEEDDEYLYDSDAEYCFDLDVLEANKWEIDDTVYGFDTGCELKLISD